MGNDRLDILVSNELGRALFSELYTAPPRPANHARFIFLDPRAEAFYADLDRAARETAAILRSAAGRDPYDRDLSDLVGQFATQSEAFRTHWAAHNVRFHAAAVKHFHHPVVGQLSLSFNRLDVAADHGRLVLPPGQSAPTAMVLPCCSMTRRLRRRLAPRADSSVWPCRRHHADGMKRAMARREGRRRVPPRPSGERGEVAGQRRPALSEAS